MGPPKPCPHVGHVCLLSSRATAGEEVLFHTITEEEAPIPFGGRLLFMGSGFGYIVLQDGSQKWVKDFLKQPCAQLGQDGEAAKLYYKSGGATVYYHKQCIEMQHLTILKTHSCVKFVRAVCGSWMRFNVNDIQEWEAKAAQQEVQAEQWKRQVKEASGGAAAGPPGPAAAPGSAAGPPGPAPAPGSAGHPGPPAAEPPAAKKAKKKIAVPDLAQEQLQEYMPASKGAFAVVDEGQGRCRAYYPTAHSMRASSSASIGKYGMQEAMRMVLRWAWKEHEVATGTECPYDLYMLSAVPLCA
eukprot:CAMPEP_0204523936 /NCGR_PEP_ID=MMETSP0661-20131031/7106_1 /ASSEMBLY_ACC=CAM_ASM_000606 /TAXON_ID=109239 /ORGANISM="Alexandrium margalefi, Strain AMGDE01CS-322" /LENGTH=298 /DNA_ID=CAMNT_0051529663 /DNA_START=36 /DNA_END=932 /DNA_ORIENTATION=+